ncbi:retropepsin-like aspartic protease family protein [Rhodoligotrophos defluvii]|uniref:retropepsin-like aspartic protease family protein n=1 Tax=Rhodoligotrophos defluvii TaxID=2561934 RepID=UPI0010C9CCEF|nr:TIGR02281 family clan AA aspartic protease [Rhodoligotrophos defluvii]
MIGWLGIGILALAAIILILVDDPGGAIGITDADFARLASAAALLLVIGLPLLWSYRGRINVAAQHIATWLFIALVLLIAYTYRFELSAIGQRLAGELVPGLPATRTVSVGGADQQIVTIRADASGHFNLHAEINGHPLAMLLDTGATTVTLSYEDAQRVGINPADLYFNVPVDTANGRSRAAEVRLQSVSVGGISVPGLRALVTQPGAMRGSLLGMNFLRSLGAFEFRGSELVLRP